MRLELLEGPRSGSTHDCSLLIFTDCTCEFLAARSPQDTYYHHSSFGKTNILKLSLRLNGTPTNQLSDRPYSSPNKVRIPTFPSLVAGRSSPVLLNSRADAASTLISTCHISLLNSANMGPERCVIIGTEKQNTSRM